LKVSVRPAADQAEHARDLSGKDESELFRTIGAI